MTVKEGWPLQLPGYGYLIWGTCKQGGTQGGPKGGTQGEPP